MATPQSADPEGRETVEKHLPSESAQNTAIACEAEEKPVREKLRDAAISSQHGSVSPPSSDAEMRQFTPPEDDSPKAKGDAAGRLKPARKRSLEDLKDTEPGMSSLDAPATPSSGTHARKKSKEQGTDTAKAPAERKPEPTVQEEGQSEGQSPDTPKSGSDQAREDAAMSPRRKRSAEEMGTEPGRSSKVAATEEAQKARKSLDEDRPNLPHGTTDSGAAGGDMTAPKLPSKFGGFGNASASSPFASFGTKPSGSKPKATVSSFGTFAASSAASSTTTTTTPAISSSATNLSFSSAKSPFATATAAGSKSAFGGGTGFGSASKLSSFASAKGDFTAPPALGSKLGAFASPSGGDFPPASSNLGRSSAFASANGGDLNTAKPSRPFGAPAASKEKDDDTETSDAGDDDDGTEGGDGTGEDVRPDDDAGKFQLLDDVATGEEDEVTLFSTRAKLYVFEGGWKERGTGIIKLNKQRKSDSDEPQSADHSDLESSRRANGNTDEETDGESGSSNKDQSASKKPRVQARLLMRAMATHRVLLNAPIYDKMPIGDPQDVKNAPSGKRMMFLAQDDTKLKNHLLQIGREDELAKLYSAIKTIQLSL